MIVRNEYDLIVVNAVGSAVSSGLIGAMLHPAATDRGVREVNLGPDEGLIQTLDTHLTDWQKVQDVRFILPLNARGERLHSGLIPEHFAREHRRSIFFCGGWLMGVHDGVPLDGESGAEECFRDYIPGTTGPCILDCSGMGWERLLSASMILGGSAAYYYSLDPGSPEALTQVLTSMNRQTNLHVVLPVSEPGCLWNDRIVQSVSQHFSFPAFAGFEVAAPMGSHLWSLRPFMHSSEAW